MTNKFIYFTAKIGQGRFLIQKLNSLWFTMMMIIVDGGVIYIKLKVFQLSYCTIHQFGMANKLSTSRQSQNEFQISRLDSQ